MSKVIKIGISSSKGSKIKTVSYINAIAGKGLENDRFYKENNNKSSQLTLIEKENIDYVNNQFGLIIPYEDFRRNIITEGIKLNNLVNKKISIGNVTLLAHDLCEPCKHLQDIINQKNLVKNLVHKGGLRCEILTNGKISVGDIIKY
tara:strand:- start:272 stop:712 length:441 start_codon:yes stop_codon:yes gene_type:complete